MISHATHEVSDSYYIEDGLWMRGRNVIVFLALVSWLACIAGWITNPTRFYQSYLLGYLFVITIPLGGMFFIMVQFLTGSAWSVPMRRLGETIILTIGAGIFLFIPVALGLDKLYSWMDRPLVY